MLSRRAVILGLSGASAVVAADLVFGGRGHRHGGPKAGGAPTSAPPVDAFWRSEAVDEQSLVDAYEAATRDHPALAATLALPLAHHREHLAALTHATASATSVPPTTTSSGPAPGADEVAERRDTLGALQARETAAAGRRSAAAVKDLGGGTLLARIAAAEAVHADYLAAAVTAIVPPAPSSSAPAPPLATSARPTLTQPPRTTSVPPPPRTTSTPPRPSTSRPAPTTPKPSSTTPKPTRTTPRPTTPKR